MKLLGIRNVCAAITFTLARIHVAHCYKNHLAGAPLQAALAQPGTSINGIPPIVREFWIRQANALVTELVSPCPIGAFASVVVNHTASQRGELVCIGLNTARITGDPIAHGEIAAIQNCTAILADPAGPYQLTPAQTRAAFTELSLYTNAESCPMCASAIRLAGFREYVYGVSTEALVELGWTQIRIPSVEIFRQSFDLPNPARLVGGILAEETEPMFSWQFNPETPCPQGCQRAGGARQPV